MLISNLQFFFRTYHSRRFDTSNFCFFNFKKTFIEFVKSFILFLVNAISALLNKKSEVKNDLNDKNKSSFDKIIKEYETSELDEIQLAYAIGVAIPLSINVETFGTGSIDDERISKLIAEVFDLRPGAIILDLDLRRPIYRQVASYGHFGRDDLDLPWERIDRVDALRASHDRL